MGELQLHGFANDDCKSAPGFVSVVEEFVVVTTCVRVVFFVFRAMCSL